MVWEGNLDEKYKLKKKKGKVVKKCDSESKRKQRKRKMEDKVLLKAISNLHFFNGNF